MTREAAGARVANWLSTAPPTESMEYAGQAPAPPLDRFIDDIYCLTGVPRHRRMIVPPMPSAHLFVNLGRPVRLWASDPSVPAEVCTDGPPRCGQLPRRR
jgi:hypothetical protein